MDELMEKIEASRSGVRIYVGTEWPTYAVPQFFHWPTFREYNLKLAYLVGVGIDKT
jgi:hypothetical protein